MKFNYIIYHDNCIDGFTGFYLFMKTDAWEPKPIVYPDQPHSKNVPPDIAGKNVIIIDVAYSPEILREIMKLANKFLFIDHHVTLYEDIKNFKLKKNQEIVYDKNHSGASLVWNHFFGGKNMPKFVMYVEDNDIGAWKYEETLPFIAALEVEFKLDPNFENLRRWDALLEDVFVDRLVESGEKYEIYKNYLIDRYSNKYSLMSFPGKKIAHMFPDVKYKVAVTSALCPSVSLLGKKIAQDPEVDFVMLWNYILDRKKFVVSLRSTKVDVGKIAKIFGGGGHKYAAAFSFSKADIDLDSLFESLES
jgi:uncharacterized protein